MNKQHLYAILPISFFALIFSSMLFAKNNRRDGHLLSPPVLIVDLDGDGFETISLKESNVYFDMDGDGLVERTQWIDPDDGMFLAYSLLSKQWPIYTPMTIQKHMMFGFLGRSKLKPFEENGMTKQYFGIEPSKPLNAKYYGPRMHIRKGGEGVPNRYYTGSNKSSKHCDISRIVYESKEKMVAHCKNGARYPVKEVRFEYEDSNLPWDVYCKNLKFAAFDALLEGLSPIEGKASEYDFLLNYTNIIMCLDQGFQPEIPEENKAIDRRESLARYLKRLKEYKPGMFSGRVK